MAATAMDVATDPVLQRTFRGHRDAVTCLAFRPSLTQLASGSLDHAIMVWNFRSGLRPYRFVGHKAEITAVDFSPSGQLLASSSRDKTVRLWTPNVRGDVTCFTAHTSTVRTVQFSSDNAMLLTASDDKTVKLWSTGKYKFLHTLQGHLNWVRAAVFSPDARLAASGSDDKTVKLWDLSTKSCTKTYHEHNGLVTSVAFHPSGNIIGASSSDRSIKLWDIRMHRLIQHYPEAHAGGAVQSLGDNAQALGTVNSVAFGGTQGDWMISTGNDGVVKIWDLREGHLLYTLHGHKTSLPTTAAVFSPHADFFATAGADAQVLVWKSNLGQYYDSGGSGGVGAGAQGAEELGATRDRSPTKIERSKSTSPVKSPRASSPSLRNNGRPSFRASTSIVPPPADLEPLSMGPPLASARQPPTTRPAYVADSVSVPTTTPLRERTVPDSLANTLDQVVSQLDVLTATMNILERRLTSCEDRVKELLQAVLTDRERAPPATPPAPFAQNGTTTP
ncbi:hypothetical protein RI367_003761 [Sorochytrium milnesiophthora]